MGQGQSRYCPFAFCALVLFGCDDIPCRFPFLAEGERRKIMSKQKNIAKELGYSLKSITFAPQMPQ